MKRLLGILATLVILLGSCTNAMSPAGGPNDQTDTIGISLDSSKVKTVYTVGDPLELSGLSVTVTHSLTGSIPYTYGSTADAAKVLSSDPAVGSQLKDSGFKDVNVTATVLGTNIGTASYKIFVNPDGNSLSDNFTYTISGDDSTGYKLGIKDKNGGSTVTADLPNDCTGVSVTSDNDKITVTCNSESEGGEDGTVTTTIDKPVVPTLTGIEIVTPPSRTTPYIIGQDTVLDLTGLKVNAIYDIGDPEEVVPASLQLSGYDLTKAGTYDVTVKYLDQTAPTTFSITVQDAEPGAPNLTGIEIVTPPSRTTPYIIGQDPVLDLTGLKVNAIYDTGDPQEVAIASLQLSGYDLTKAGTYDVTVKYQGQTAPTTFSITVNPAPRILTGIEIVTPPSRTTPYIIGKDTVLDLTGLKVNANYNNGDSEEVLNTSLQLSGYDLTKADTYDVIVKYQGQTAPTTFSITVNPAPRTLTGIEIASEPTNETYYIGSATDLDLTGLAVNLVYDDNGTTVKEPVANINDLSISSVDLTTKGYKVVTVTYSENRQDYTDNFTIKVTRLVYATIAGTAIPTDPNYNSVNFMSASGITTETSIILCANEVGAGSDIGTISSIAGKTKNKDTLSGIVTINSNYKLVTLLAYFNTPAPTSSSNYTPVDDITNPSISYQLTTASNTTLYISVKVTAEEVIEAND